MPRDHKKLKVFTAADELVVAVYNASRSFPSEERYGITSQLRRAAISVPTNIVEGCARGSEREYTNFLNIAYGSLAETGYLIELSHKLGLLPTESFQALHARYEEVSRMLNGLISSLKS